MSRIEQVARQLGGLPLPSFRFWEFVNGGAVRLKLSRGQVLRHHSYKPDEEGYSVECHQWEMQASGILTDEWHYEGQDCDGRITRDGRRTFDPLRDPYSEGPGIRFPIWQEDKRASRQRDFSAERAGY